MIDKTKITKGLARYDDAPPRTSGCEWERIVVGDTPIYECYNSTGDDDALVCDAFNTFTATGLTPSELAEQRDALSEALRMIRREDDKAIDTGFPMIRDHQRRQIDEALALADPHPEQRKD